MALLEKINNDLKDSLRSGNKIQAETLRMLKSAIKYVEIEVGHPLDDTEILAVITKQVKQRRDSAEQFTKGHRPDLVDKENAEIAILEQYLPAQLSATDIEAKAKAIIAQLGVTDASGTGQVMKQLMADLKGQADGKLVSAVVRQLLK